MLATLLIIVASIAAGMIVNHVHPEYRKGETGRMVTLGSAGIVVQGWLSRLEAILPFLRWR